MSSSSPAYPSLTAGEVSAQAGSSRQVAVWLLACCALVFLIIVVGGVTRLTHSGLSITEWQPIVGTVPPLSDAAWNEAFHKYQATPEYQQVNHGMTLDAFKGIFWLEYFHRLLGRIVGAVFIVPLLWFAARGKISSRLAPGLLLIFALGGLQGALGWYMVRSGLVDDPRVSQIRLTAHLGLALLILAAMFWTALSLLRTETKAAHGIGPLARFSSVLAGLVFLMALTGGLVAGTHAGLAYNTFPLMNGHVVPPEIMSIDPWYLNFVDNMATVQFDHRLLAWVLAIAVPLLWWRVRSDTRVAPRARWAAHVLLAALIVQISLGISTLLQVVPVPLAAAHQAGAVVLFTASLLTAHALR
jgi:cytochrome c oxidase assembly protein subunit 15